MNKIILNISLIISLLLTSCASSDPHTKHFTSLKNYPKSKKIMARLTTYSVNEKRGDKWTRKKQSSTGLRLIDKKTLAADPKDIPYFSKVKLPCFDYLLTVIDTGSALKKRTASRKLGFDLPVVDLFFDKEKDAIKFRKENPMFMEILVYN